MARNGIQEEISSRQLRAIESLMQCDSLADAAEDASVPLRTLARWLASDEVFVATLRAARMAAAQRAIDRLAGALSTSADTIISLAKECTDPPTKLRAARAIPEVLMKLSEHADIEARLAALEAALAGMQTKGEQ